jgi:CRISPR-associated protein Cmr1
MQTIEAQYEIVTPMFISGGDPQDAELRPPSIKGALRFWWRALQWGNCLKNSAGNEQVALSVLHRQEAELFGAAMKESTERGQGQFFIKLKNVNQKGIITDWPRNNDAGAGFLGYGLDITQSGDPHRVGIRPRQFTVCLVLKAKISMEQINQLKNTLILWGLLGGLGSRSRRGFGSVAIKQLDERRFDFSHSENYFAAIKNQLKSIPLAPAMPIFTAVNDAMHIAQAGQATDYRRLMDRLGGQYKEARKRAGKGFAKLPFGLPLAGNRGASDEKNRRGSPLLMHIHPIESHYVAMVTLIPARFHPNYPEGNQLNFYQTLQDYINSMERVYP